MPFSLYLSRGGGGEGGKKKRAVDFSDAFFIVFVLIFEILSLLSCIWECNPCRNRLADTDPLFCSAVLVKCSRDVATRGRYSCLISSSVFCHLQTTLNLDTLVGCFKTLPAGDILPKDTRQQLWVDSFFITILPLFVWSWKLLHKSQLAHMQHKPASLLMFPKVVWVAALVFVLKPWGMFIYTTDTEPWKVLLIALQSNLH